MRICHVIEAAGGGGGRVVCNMAKAAAAAGHDVTVVYARPRSEEALLSEMSASARLFPTSMQRSVGLKDFIDLIRLIILLRRAGPFDIIHGHSSKAGTLSRIAGLIFPRAAKIYTPHAFVTMAPGTPSIYGRIEYLMSYFCKAVIVLSATEKAHAQEILKIPGRKLHVIPNGIDAGPGPDRGQARTKLGYGPDDFVFGFVGRFVRQKNLSRLLDAFAIASSEAPNLKLAVVGDGEEREDFAHKLNETGLGPKVTLFKDYRGCDAIPGFDCLVCSSDYEGFPVIFLEALAGGTPIISSPVGGAVESITPGETGYIARDFTARALADAMLEIAQKSASVRERMAAQCNALAKQFSIEAVLLKTLDLYRDSLS